MDYSRAFAISAAGMSVERTRVDVAALNLANANTVQGVDGVSYQPVRVVAHSVAAGAALPVDFAEQIDMGLDGVQSSQAYALNLPEASIEPTGVKPRLSYEPGNPFANEKGYVAYAGVDTATEMISMMSATRSYEANVAAMNMAKTLALRALNIGGSSS